MFNDMQRVLSIDNLRKTYGDKTAVEDISFHVARGEIVGLLGPNGAGKTTTINMVLGILEPTAGNIAIDGLYLRTRRSEAMNRTNFAAVYAPLPGNLTVLHNLTFFGMLYDVDNLKTRLDDVLIQYDLVKYKNTKCGVLSSGEATRVCLAKAMLSSPQLLLLDEPTASLDPATAQDIRRHIRQFAQNGAGGVLWTSHNMQEVTDVCDRVLFLSHGRILLEGDPKTLPAAHGKKDLEELFVSVAREPLTLEGVAA